MVMGFFNPKSPAILPTPDEDDDDTPFIKRRCFVVMPFGQKFDSQQLNELARTGFKIEPGANVERINFDHTYDKLIEPAVCAADIECTRSDKIGQSGYVHREMLESIATFDVVIVDITTQNANVFYELGIRHCFRQSTTILIRRQGTQIPFNITGMRVFDYDDSETPGPDGTSPLDKSQKLLTEVIKRSFRYRDNDSLVHNLLPNVTVRHTTFPIMDQLWIARDIVNVKKEPTGQKIGYVTGDLMHVRGVDAWVNPENTKMEMARMHDGSVSSLIRYFGAKRDRKGLVVRDTIRKTLDKIVGRAGVEPGTVIATWPGELGRTNNVKAIFHVAGLQGEPGYGYQTVRDYPGCVRRVLGEIERFNIAPYASTSPLRPGWLQPAPGRISSVVIPLFGSRSSPHSAQEVAMRLFRAAAVFLQQHPSAHLKSVYFLAYTDQDRNACDTALGGLAAGGYIEQPKRAVPPPPSAALTTSLFGIQDADGPASPAVPPAASA